MGNNKLYDGKIINFIKEKNYTVINSNLGKGSFGAREGAKYLKLFGLEGKVDLFAW